MSRIGRALASLLSLATFLVASWGEARALDPCPHHDALPGAVPAMAHHAHGHGEQHHHPAGDHGGAQHGPCKCLGGCDGGPRQSIAPRHEAAAVLLAPPATYAPAAAPLQAAPRPAGLRWSPYLPHAPPLSV